MKKRPVLRLLSVVALQLAPAVAFSESMPGSAEPVEVLVEARGGERFFRVRVNWPAQDVPSNANIFRPAMEEWSPDGYWPADTLELVPQDNNAHLVFREFSSEGETGPPDRWEALSSLPSPVTFVGKLRARKPQEFLLRCPQPGGNFAYLPLKVDFARAKPGKDLLGAWRRAEADFFALAPAPADVSFFAFASEKARARLNRAAGRAMRRPPRGAGRPGLYEITTGATALQESLQLDRLRGGKLDLGARTVPLERIAGVEIREHPWQKMLAGKSPAIEPIAGLIPADQYYLRFNTIKAMRDVLDFADHWGGSILAEVDLGGREYGVREKMERQICLRTSWLSTLLGESVIESLALTGSDPYLREGTDLAIVFRLKSEPLFFAAVNRYIEEARRERPDLVESRTRALDTEIEAFTTADGTVRCHRAKIDEYAVYANSRAALLRVIEAARGKRPSLKTALDFAYMRSLFPLGAAEEDGFLFLSDPFLRAITGPRLRIAEKRRLDTLTTLEMVKNAALLYLFERPGAKVPTLEQMLKTGVIDRADLALEPGDRLTWDPEAFVARSQRYGRTGDMTPNSELVIDKVTEQEKTEYEIFRRNYQDYWRQYFDPVGIRITARDRLALSVTILPLLDHSEYNQAKNFFGGAAIELEPLNRGDSVVAHFAAHLNPESEDYRRMQSFAVNLLPDRNRATVEWIGERVEFWIEDHPALDRKEGSGQAADFFQIPMVGAIEVKNPLGLTAFLVALKSLVDTSAPNMVVFEPTERYRDFGFTRIRPGTQATASAPEFHDAAIYYGAVGKMFYISTSFPALQRVVDKTLAPAGKAASERFGAAPQGHLALRLDVDGKKSAQAYLQRKLAQRARRSEFEHLEALGLVARIVGMGPGALLSPEAVLGYSIKSALGNNYRYDRTRNEVAGSRTGTRWTPTWPEPLPADTDLARLIGELRSLRATMEFTPEGLHTEISLQRRPGS